GRARRSVVSVMPQRLPDAAAAPDTRPVACSYCMGAAPMSLRLHGCGTHAVWSGAAGAGVRDVRFRCTTRPMAGRERTTINLKLTGNADSALARRPPGDIRLTRNWVLCGRAAAADGVLCRRRGGGGSGRGWVPGRGPG